MTVAVGDRVLVKMGLATYEAEVIEDRGRIGVGGRRIWRVRASDMHEWEVPEVELVQTKIGEKFVGFSMDEARVVRSALDSFIYEVEQYIGDGLDDDDRRRADTASARDLMQRIDTIYADKSSESKP